MNKPPPKKQAPFVCERCHGTCSARSWDPTVSIKSSDGKHVRARLICARCKALLRAEALKRDGKPPEATRRPTAAALTIPLFSEEDMKPRRVR